MTNTESLVTSLDLSRHLKEAGCPQDTAFHWIQWATSEAFKLVSMSERPDIGFTTYAAFTAEELLRLLSPGCRVYRPGRHTNEWLAEAPYLDLMEEGDDGDLPHWTGAESAANALAKLYLVLQKKNLL